MKFKIDWVEEKTSSKGTSYRKCTMTSETGEKFENVAVFSSFSMYQEVQAGREVEGKIEIKESSQYGKSFSLVDDKPAQAPRGNGIAKAMERKETSIAKTMDRKENGMLLSGSSRDATLITLAQLTGRNFTDEEFKTKWKMWRTWLIDNHGDPENISETKAPF